MPGKQFRLIENTQTDIVRDDVNSSICSDSDNDEQVLGNVDDLGVFETLLTRCC